MEQEIQNSRKKRILQKQINKRIFDSFFIFILEKWRISSGEHSGEQFSIRDAPCLLEILQDDFPFQVTMKSAQSRISEINVARAIHKAISQKGNILYTFPAGEQMQQFVDARIRTAVINNEFLSQFITGSLNLKKFSLNKNSLYFRGVQKRRQVISVDASTLFADEIAEYDDDSTINTLNKRLGATSTPFRSYYSTPKFSSSDIALYYYGDDSQKERGSDRRVYSIKCERCGQWNLDLIWGENTRDLNERDSKFSFYKPDIIVICRFCKKSLDRLAVGEWVPEIKANSDYCHGRHISKLFLPNANLNQIHEDLQNPVKEQETYNSDLGLPYQVKGSKLTDEIINQARGPYIISLKSDKLTNVGVDVGNKIHVVTSIFEDSRLKVTNAFELDEFDELSFVYKDYNVKSFVIDMNPEKDKCEQFQRAHENVYLAFFKQSLENSKDMFELDDASGIISVHRTLMMIRILDMITEKKILLPMNIGNVNDFYEHLKAVIKALKQDNNQNWVTFFPKTKKADHYFFSLLYNILAFSIMPAQASFKIIRGLSL